MIAKVNYQKNRKSANLNRVFPIFSIEEDKVILKDGRVAVGFILTLIEMESMAASDYEHLNQVFAGVLKLLPVGAIVQKTDIYYDKAYLVEENGHAFFEARMHKHFFDRLMLFHKSYLFISFPATAKSLKATPFTSYFSSGKPLLKNPFEGIDERLEIAETLSNEFASGFSDIKDLKFKKLDNIALKELYIQYTNLEFDKKPQEINREMFNDAAALNIGEKKVNIVSLKGQGSDIFNSVKNHYGISVPMIYPLTQYLQFPHILTQSILIEDTDRQLKIFDTDKKVNRSLDFLTTQDNELKAAEIDEFTAGVRANNSQLVSIHLSVTVYEINDKLRKAFIEKTVSAFRALQGCETVVESFDTANLFFANMPGNAFQNYRWLVTSGEMATNYFHFTTSYRNSRTGDYLCDRFRNPLQVNLFNTALNNQNALVIGPSGSGKSYAIGNFIVQRFEKNARQIILDIGGSYRNVIISLNSDKFEETYFEYDPEHPIAFNPFLIQKSKGKYVLNSDKLNFLVSLLSVIWKGSRETSLTPAENAIFKLLIPAYYDSLNQNKRYSPGLTSFYNWLIWYHTENKDKADYRVQMQFFQVEQFLVVLKPFISGTYKNLLDARFEVDISDHRLVCFDLDKIKTDANLYPVVAMLITELALDQIRKFPDDIKYIYLDEAWSMLSGTLSEFIESMFRTIRKNNGSCCIITQGIDEIISSPIGPAIITNAATQIILNHTDKNAIEKLARHLGLTDHEMEKIISIRVSKNYREFFIKQGDYGKVYLLEASPYLDAVLSSKPMERNYLKKLVERFGNIAYGVNQYVEDKKLGRGIFHV